MIFWNVLVFLRFNSNGFFNIGFIYFCKSKWICEWYFFPDWFNTWMILILYKQISTGLWAYWTYYFLHYYLTTIYDFSYISIFSLPKHCQIVALLKRFAYSRSSEIILSLSTRVVIFRFLLSLFIFIFKKWIIKTLNF